MRRVSASPIRFVILSTARSGTSVLKETLGTHPDIFVHGEVFHEKIEWHIHPEYRATRDISLRETDPVGFVREILDSPMGRRLVGFKMWRSQSVPACTYVMDTPEIIKIVLERKNRLAAYSSSLLARQTQVWNIRGLKQRQNMSPPAKLRFQPRAFRRFLQVHDTLFETYRRGAKGTVLNISYQQVAQLDLPEVFRTLGIEGFPFRHQMQKLYTSDILDRFEAGSHPAIHSELARIGHGDWIRETVT